MWVRIGRNSHFALKTLIRNGYFAKNYSVPKSGVGTAELAVQIEVAIP